jgi:uncharacterized protein
MTNDPRVPRVGVVGASARAAVHSLARAGCSAWAVDLFGDRDLAAPFALCPFDRYPRALAALASEFPSGPVLYTGGLENHPRVVAELAAGRELWGNPPDVLRRVRDPHVLSAILSGKGFAHPRVLPRGEPCPAMGRWLVKAERSSGGIGVRAATPGERPAAREYLQEFVDGPAMSAVFRAEPPRVELFGITEQLIGTSWLHARGFKYAGNIGPAAVSANVESQLALLGWRLVAALALRGVFGVDFILHDDAPWVVEVNPRYPASVEVLEHATGRAVFGQPVRGLIHGSVGKAIYYAPHRVDFPAAGPWDTDLEGEFDPWRLPAFADIPHPGAVIEIGWPVLTILVSGSSPDEVRERLQSRAAKLDQLLAGSSP